MRRTLPALLMLMAAAAGAQEAEFAPAPYDDVAARLGGVLDFETLGALPEPGRQIAGLIAAPGITLGERFAGQSRGSERRGPADTLYDAPQGRPEAPLRALPGPEGENASVALHRGFGSAALFPLGPAGFPAVEALGEGGLAVVFAADLPALGLRVHADYPDPLGTRPPPAPLEIWIYRRDGSLAGRLTVPLSHGVNDIALAQSAGAPAIAGFALRTADPGGIAVDDILYAPALPGV